MNKEETLSDKSISEFYFKDKKEITYYLEKDVKDFIKKLIKVAEDNDWEVAVDDGYEDGFKIISGKDYIKLKAGADLI